MLSYLAALLRALSGLAEEGREHLQFQDHYGTFPIFKSEGDNFCIRFRMSQKFVVFKRLTFVIVGFVLVFFFFPLIKSQTIHRKINCILF